MTPVERNKRNARCKRCKVLLLPGDGIRHQYVMFGGNDPNYYLCPMCDMVYQQEEAEKVERRTRPDDGFRWPSTPDR